MSEYIVDFGGSMAMLARIIESQSANLREEIVRCKDCKHFVVDQSDHEYRSGWWCKRWNTDMVEPTGFCAWAVKRKEGGDD